MDTMYTTCLTKHIWQILHLCKKHNYGSCITYEHRKSLTLIVSCLMSLFTAVKIKKNRDNVKFKVRCSRYLYTLVISDREKAEKLKQSLPPGQYAQYVESIFTGSRIWHDHIHLTPLMRVSSHWTRCIQLAYLAQLINPSRVFKCKFKKNDTEMKCNTSFVFRSCCEGAEIDTSNFILYSPVNK